MNKIIAIGLLGVSVLVQTFAHAETAPDEDLLPIVESYVVRKGDTLAKLARRHLGPDAAWNTNVAVNPDLPDPNVIKLGQVINIITGYEQPAPVVVVEPAPAYQAVIDQIFNVVEKNVERSDWSGAIEGDRLFPLDAVRTLENSVRCSPVRRRHDRFGYGIFANIPAGAGSTGYWCKSKRDRNQERRN